MRFTEPVAARVTAQGYATVNDLSELTGRAKGTIRGWLREGRIAAECDNGTWKIDPASAMAFAWPRHKRPHKLSAQSVREIRALEGTMQNYELAEKYEISAGMVTRILNGTRRGNV
jgi:hypothetical protein